MVFCTNCGKELSAGAKFCNSCGKEQILSENSCSKCGKILEENEKFCSGCGTQVEHKTEPKAEPQVQAETEQEQKEQFTKEGRKIITGGPKPEQNPPVPPPIQAQKKKKSGCRGCLIAFLIFLLVVIIIGAAGVFILNKITDGEIIEKFREGYNSTKSEQTDIENESPVNNISTPAALEKPVKIKENKSVKQIASAVEDVFEKSDTTLLKQLLTETSQQTFEGVFAEIYPYMPQYAKAFKKRKLIRSTKNFALYEFEDEEGNKYTVEFALTGDGNWKLVRF